MAEINVKLKGDDSELKAKFIEASGEARTFAQEVKENLGETKNIAADMLKEGGFGGIPKMFDSSKVAMVAFGAAIVEGFKGAIEKAIDFQKAVGGLKSALGPALAGQAQMFAEWVESMSGAMGTFEENMKVFQGLLATGMEPAKAQETLINIQNAAKLLGISVEELGQKFVEMRGEGEVPPRMFREFPALAAQVRARLPAGPAPAPGAPAVPEEEGLAARVKAAGGADWMLKVLLPALAPGGLQAPIRAQAAASTAGQMADLTAEMNKAWREMGTELLPTVNRGLRDLRGVMPTLTQDIVNLGERIGKFMEDLFGTQHRLEHPSNIVGKDLKKLNTFLEGVEMRVGELFGNPMKLLQEAAQQQKDAAAALHRAVNPQQ